MTPADRYYVECPEYRFQVPTLERAQREAAVLNSAPKHCRLYHEVVIERFDPVVGYWRELVDPNGEGEEQ